MPEASRSIGQVLTVVKVDFPDISISKIRFLESEGLLSPERAPSGYRRYRQGDIDRLRYILAMQKNHYLPLKVIREHLDMLDRGLTPPPVDAPVPTAPVEVASPVEPVDVVAAPVAEASLPRGQRAGAQPAPRRPVRLTRRELIDASGLSEAALIELERQQILHPRRGTVYYGRDALTLAVAARRLAAYGIDARHLRAFKQAAEREVGIIEQAIAPYVRRNAHAHEAQADVMQLVTMAHAALMHSAMQR